MTEHVQQGHMPFPLALTTGGIHLHLGCGHQRLPVEDGWVNCDLARTEAADLCFDLQAPWPFPESSADVVYASHVIEHIPEPMRFFEQAWHTMQDGGMMLLRMPYGDHVTAMADLTHIRPWYPESFYCLLPDYERRSGNPQFSKGWGFGIDRVEMILAEWTRRWTRWRWQRRFTMPLVPRVLGTVVELWVSLIALKSPRAVQQWAADFAQSPFRFRYSQWAHVMAGQPLPPGTTTTLTPLAVMRQPPR